MKKAEKQHRHQVTEILKLAFADNNSIRDIVGHGPGCDGRLKSLIGYAIDICQTYGKIWVSEDGNACALVLFPDRRKFSLRSVLWDLKLVIRVVGLANIFRVMRRESLIARQHFLTKSYYLWFIGVRPECQGQGIGSAFLSGLLADAEFLRRTVFLETSVERNVAWYRKFGLQVYHEQDMGYPLFFMHNL